MATARPVDAWRAQIGAAKNERGMTWRAVAETSGLSLDDILNYLSRRKCKPPIESVPRIAEAVGLNGLESLAILAGIDLAEFNALAEMGRLRKKLQECQLQLADARSSNPLISRLIARISEGGGNHTVSVSPQLAWASAGGSVLKQLDVFVDANRSLQESGLFEINSWYSDPELAVYRTSFAPRPTVKFEIPIWHAPRSPNGAIPRAARVPSILLASGMPDPLCDMVAGGLARRMGWGLLSMKDHAFSLSNRLSDTGEVAFEEARRAGVEMITAGLENHVLWAGSDVGGSWHSMWNDLVLEASGLEDPPLVIWLMPGHGELDAWETRSFALIQAALLGPSLLDQRVSRSPYAPLSHGEAWSVQRNVERTAASFQRQNSRLDDWTPETNPMQLVVQMRTVDGIEFTLDPALDSIEFIVRMLDQLSPVYARFATQEYDPLISAKQKDRRRAKMYSPLQAEGEPALSEGQLSGLVAEVKQFLSPGATGSVCWLTAEAVAFGWLEELYPNSADQWFGLLPRIVEDVVCRIDPKHVLKTDPLFPASARWINVRPQPWSDPWAR